MDCNKDEAIRAKEISQKKLINKDTTGAKKFALKARSLFPELEGLSQFIEVIGVYAAYERTINGEPDYYTILGVHPFANEEVLKKQYKKMALALHPDKNRSVGADGAFKRLSQAWSILSDKVKRADYDLKLNIRASSRTSSCSSSTSMNTTTTTTTSQQVPTTSTTTQYIPTQARTPATTGSPHYSYAPQSPRNQVPGSSSHQNRDFQNSPSAPFRAQIRHPVPPSYNSYAHFSNPHLNPGYQRTPPPVSPQYIPVPGAPSHRQSTAPVRNPLPTSNTCPLRSETFWTSCSSCRIMFEYHRRLVNLNLLCTECSQPFLATEIPAPSVNIPRRQPKPCAQQQQTMSPASGLRSVPVSGARTTESASSLHTPPNGVLKRGHERTSNVTLDKEATLHQNNSARGSVQGDSAATSGSSHLKKEKPIKRRRKNDQKFDSAAERSQGTSGSFSGFEKTSSNLKRNSGTEKELGSMKELSQIEIRTMLMKHAEMEIKRFLYEQDSKPGSSQMKAKERKDPVSASERTESGRDSVFFNPKRTSEPQNTSTLEDHYDTEANPDDSVSMAVPDANFHNFDDDRVEESFAENQVWAAYDDDDGMPRYYALIQHVISRKPFKMQISWLNSKSTSEFGSVNWLESGFTKTSGHFRVGKSVVNRRLNSFSHPVKWRKGARGAIQVFPGKGDVWALYRNWSPDWNKITTAEEVVHKYDLVLVLQDFNENGVVVAPLVKVAGFTSIFNKLLDQTETRTIPKEEMFRFSHQVPIYKLNGLETENALKGCFELDPAALPLELLKVITDTEAAEQEKVPENPTIPRRRKVENEVQNLSKSAGNTKATQEVTQNVNPILTYSRKKKRRED